MKIASVLGSFLDPLADKILICCTAGALLYDGVLPLWAASPIIARDLCLIGGTYVHYTISGSHKPMSFHQHLLQMQLSRKGYTVQPTRISKINTALQLSLVAACMGHGWMQWPTQSGIDLMAKLTVMSTLGSWGMYTWDYFNGRGVIS